jgi:hypothetical protein
LVVVVVVLLLMEQLELAPHQNPAMAADMANALALFAATLARVTFTAQPLVAWFAASALATCPPGCGLRLVERCVCIGGSRGGPNGSCCCLREPCVCSGGAVQAIVCP